MRNVARFQVYVRLGHNQPQIKLKLLLSVIFEIDEVVHPPAYLERVCANRSVILWRTNSPNVVNSANPSPITLLHIIVIHRPNFEENGRISEVAMNGQAFYGAK